MSDTEQERFYSLAGTVFDRENPIIEDNSYFCCTTPDKAKIAVKMLNTLNAKPIAEGPPTVNIPREWLPTSANINALPEPVRSYIADIETRCDPQYTMQQSVLLKDQVRQLEHKLQEYKATIAEQGAEIARLNKRTDDLVGLFIGDDHESPLGKKVMSVLAPMAVDEESELEKVWADVKAIGVGYLYKSKRIDPVLLYAYGSKDTVSISKDSAGKAWEKQPVSFGRGCCGENS